MGDNNDVVANYANANVIAVGAIASSGARASYSNYGATTVDIFGIWSTVPSTAGKGSKAVIVGGYASYSGTSSERGGGMCAASATTVCQRGVGGGT